MNLKYPIFFLTLFCECPTWGVVVYFLVRRYCDDWDCFYLLEGVSGVMI